ncbi:MAG TPA: nucleotide exchange factor GrpE [Blastocatellia bacterium]|nr:nucleotide exchange factor GrpE [Blastocatellia bacterium]
MSANLQSAGDPQQVEQNEVERLREELAREREMHMRTLADFENFRRRIQRERAEAALAGKREIILSLIDAIDSFDLALDHISDASSAIGEGLQSIRRKLLSTLEAHGVTRFESRGRTFDPSLHEAIGTVESNQYEPGVVAEVTRDGYRWGEQVLRPAQVRVTK